MNLAGCGGYSRPYRAREGRGPLPTLLSPHPPRVPSRRCPARRRDSSALSMTCGLRVALRPDVILSDDAIVSGATPLREGTLRGAVGTAGRTAAWKAPAPCPRFSPPHPHRMASRRCPSRRRDSSALSMTCGLRVALRPDVILSDDAIVSGATPLREGTLRGAVGTAGRIALGKALARCQRFSLPIPTGCLRGDLRPVEATA